MLGSVVALSHRYANKELYVVKRLWTLSQDPGAYLDCGSSELFEGKAWVRGGDLPSDPELVASVFCALLNYSAMARKNTHLHLLDANATQHTLESLQKEDFALLNRQPNLLYKAHFELVFNRRVWLMPAVSFAN